MDSLILTNNGNSMLEIQDLGVQVLVGEDFDILQNFTAEDIIESFDFPSVYSQGAQIILNDGNTTHIMSLQDVYDYLTPITKWTKLDYEYISNKDDVSDVLNTELEELTNGSDTELHIHDNRYYTETELATPGQSIVHYDNIIGSPTGSTRIINGDLYYYDETRNKWLTSAEEKYLWTENVVDGKYMNIGHAGNSATGYLMPQDFTITKLSIMTSSGNQTKEFQIRINNTITQSINLVDGQYISTSLDIDLQSGDILKMFVSGAGQHVKGVVVTLFGKWRIV